MPAVRSNVVDATLTGSKADDIEWFRKFGWVGAGAWDEAKALGMDYKEYMDILLSADMRVGCELDEKLDQLVAAGTLVIKKDYI